MTCFQISEPAPGGSSFVFGNAEKCPRAFAEKIHWCCFEGGCWMKGWVYRFPFRWEVVCHWMELDLDWLSKILLKEK